MKNRGSKTLILLACFACFAAGGLGFYLGSKRATPTSALPTVYQYKSVNLEAIAAAEVRKVGTKQVPRWTENGKPLKGTDYVEQPNVADKDEWLRHVRDMMLVELNANGEAGWEICPAPVEKLAIPNSELVIWFRRPRQG